MVANMEEIHMKYLEIKIESLEKWLNVYKSHCRFIKRIKIIHTYKM